MFELTWSDEDGWRRETVNEAIPPSPLDPHISHVALLLWREHCVECSIPYCYSSCSLYVKRADFRCARFSYGIYPNTNIKGLLGFGADIAFRRWGKLGAIWPKKLFFIPVDCASRYNAWTDRLDKLIGLATSLLGRLNPSRTPNQIYSHFRERHVLLPTKKKVMAPDALYAKFWSPGSNVNRLHLEVLQEILLFRTSLTIEPGWNQHLIPLDGIEFKEGRNGSIRLWIDNDEEIRLVFEWLDLVKLSSAETALTDKPDRQAVPAEKVKCVAWDLDNTLWHGVIGDVGSDNVEINIPALNLIKELDERGILQTIASKNEQEIAWAKIKELGIEEYFLYPAINWGRKSQNLMQVASALNININTFALIDDSIFERNEVASTFPEVRVYDAVDIESLLEKAELQVPISSESRIRRKSYIAESNRRKISAVWSGDYDDFLQGCEMRLSIETPVKTTQARCLELLQRSNQFNLSGNRYTINEFEFLINCPTHNCYAFRVSDKYGDYGTVGFVALDIGTKEPTLVDFVMSCRVAMKCIDDTFILWLAYQYQLRGATRLLAVLRVTDSNKPLRDALKKLGFRIVEEKGAQRILEFDLGQKVSIPALVAIEAAS